MSRYTRRSSERSGLLFQQLTSLPAVRSDGTDDVFRIGADAVLVEVESVEFAFTRDAQSARGIHGVHDGQRDAEGGSSDNGATDCLSDEKLCASAVEEAFEGDGVVG